MSATPAQRAVPTEKCPHRSGAADGPQLTDLLENPRGFVAAVRSAEEVVAIRLGSRKLHLVTSPDLVEQILVDEATKFDAGSAPDGPGPAFGHGLAACPGSVRAARRRVIEPAFHWSRLADHARIAADTAAEAAGSWTDRTELDIPREMTHLSLATITRSLVAGPAGLELTRALRETLPAMLDDLPGLASAEPPLRPTPDAVRTALAEALDHRRSSPEHHTDALSLLLAAQGEAGGSALTDDEIAEELTGLVLAGTEAPAAVLSWVLHEVSRRPDIEERILAEIAEVLGDRPPTAADFTALLYTRQVVGEALRCYARPFLLRRASEPVLLGDRRLAPGDEILISPYALHHDPGLFPEPDCFDPYRYNGPAARRMLIPFGSDDHGCVGAGSAWQGTTIALVALLSRWRFLPVSDQPVQPVLGRTVRPNRLVLAVSCRPRPPSSGAGAVVNAPQ
ncbi:cytochrome P450 [Kitasatospora sp. NPDC001175]|uniref:cytochrome P450 n=1 Tax=Kitasatospora sp. NPDC001175 TaxID=3157103 RepID=UPI003D01B996